jgi:ribosome biogenesis GTPase / thiamine phosphate phosphatase
VLELSLTQREGLSAWGLTPDVLSAFESHCRNRGHGDRLGRVVSIHYGGLVLETGEQRVLAKPSGKSGLRAQLLVGDWVVFSLDTPATIHALLPRKSELARVSADGKAQRMVANVDLFALVLAADSALDSVHPERFVALAESQNLGLIFVITKPDVADPAVVTSALRALGCLQPCFVVHGLSGDGIEALRARFPRLGTTAMMGASGIGKSSVLNHLVGRSVQSVGETRARDGKGRHTTTHREMFQTQTGALVIDTPGMREFDVALTKDAFPDVLLFAEGCRFRDCTHRGVADCAVSNAVATGELPRVRLEAFLAMPAPPPAYENERERNSKGR